MNARSFSPRSRAAVKMCTSGCAPRSRARLRRGHDADHPDPVAARLFDQVDGLSAGAARRQHRVQQQRGLAGQRRQLVVVDARDGGLLVALQADVADADLREQVQDRAEQPSPRAGPGCAPPRRRCRWPARPREACARSPRGWAGRGWPRRSGRSGSSERARGTPPGPSDVPQPGQAVEHHRVRANVQRHGLARSGGRPRGQPPPTSGHEPGVQVVDLGVAELVHDQQDHPER